MPDNKPQRSFFQILWKNKLYVALLILLSGLLLFAQFSQEVKKGKEIARARTAQVQAQLKQAEEAFQKSIEEEGSFENYLKENPRSASILGYATLAFLILLLYGLCVEIWCLFRKFRGKKVMTTLDFVEEPRWKVGDVFRIMILFLTFSILIGWLGELLTTQSPDFWTANAELILHGTIADLIAVFLVLYFSRVKYGQSFFRAQIRKENIWKDIGIGISAYLAVLPIIFGLLLFLVWLVSIFQYEPSPQRIIEVFVQEDGRNPWLMGYALFLATVIGPAIEEIFFRGFFYAALRKRFKAIPSALVTAIFFSLLHESAFAFLPIFLLSLLLTYVYEKRKSLVAPMALHICHNVLFLSYFFIMKENFLDKFLH